MTPMLAPGQPAPWFHARSLGAADRFAFNTVAGRWIVLLFLGPGSRDEATAALATLQRNRELFDDAQASFFGVAVDPADEEAGRVAPSLPGVRWFLDYDRAVSSAYGASHQAEGRATYAPHWLLLDPMLRVRARAALIAGEALITQARAALAVPADPVPAPVLVLPDVLPPELCRRLIDLYEAHGGEESGFMREVNGVTTAVHDHQHKRRADYTVTDQALIADLKRRLASTLAPMIARAFQFTPTRIERFIVACYDADRSGHFRAHRDNTTAGTAHRKFACTINLNADGYEGGDLGFPEFGARTYRAPTGGAVVFSCSLLHEARPVTRGKRYAFLPFLYDEDGARIRERNLSKVGPEFQNYRSGLEPAAASAG